MACYGVKFTFSSLFTTKMLPGHQQSLRTDETLKIKAEAFQWIKETSFHYQFMKHF
jgi:hypothetical protein